MQEKHAPIGICDLCGSQMPRDRWYHRRGPRLYCSIDCRNTANSRAGAPVRGQRQRERVASGEWENPAHLNPPDPANIGAGVSAHRRQEVAGGTWRNPALDQAAREKLSRPRRHGDNPALHGAIERLRTESVTDLTPEEADAWRAHQRELRQARVDEARAYQREYYRRCQEALTQDEREAQRERWRQANRRRKRGRP